MGSTSPSAFSPMARRCFATRRARWCSGPDRRQGVGVEVDHPASHAQDVFGGDRRDVLGIASIGLSAQAVERIEGRVSRVHGVSLLIDGEVPDQATPRALEFSLLGPRLDQSSLSTGVSTGVLP